MPVLSRLLVIFISFWVISVSNVSAAISFKLFLNKGENIAVDSTVLPYYSFNEDSLFDPHNAVLNFKTGDTVIFTVINTDTVLHGFRIKGMGSGSVISPLDSIVQTIVFDTPGLFIYYDDYDFPKYSYLGASGMILIENSNSHRHFYWNIKEQQDSFNLDLMAGIPVNWAEYNPNHFTINSNGKPGIAEDSTAVIIANVGDTVRIMVSNTGRSVHSIHFHGFHCRVLFASEGSHLLNWSKDTFPIKKMETLILEMVPDKPGLYPVHDHNLIAVTGGGVYPNGIFMMMQID